MNLPTAAEENLEPTHRQRWWRSGVLVCLAVQFLLAWDTGRRLTPTHDEYWHLPLGLLIWKTGRFDYDVINPPLLRLWAALPLILGGANLDLEVPYTSGGTTGDLFWTSNPENRMFWFASGRVMVALVNGATGWLLAVWGRRWFGEFVGFTAALLWCSCPTVLANGSLVTHDAAAAFGYVMTIYALVCWCEQPSWKNALIAGTCLGVAQLLKVTCILLFPISIIIWLLVRPTASRDTTIKGLTWLSLAQWAIVYGMAILIINAGYLGHHTFESMSSMKFVSLRFQQWQQIPWLQSLPIPLPRSYFLAFDRVAQDLQNPHPVFLDSTWRVEGFSQYYLKALEYKLSLGSWLMIFLSAVFCWSQRRLATPMGGKSARSLDEKTGKKGIDISSRHWSQNLERHLPADWRMQLTIVIPILMLIVPASFGGNQIGIRYILPALPLLYLFAAQAAGWLAESRWSWPQWLVVAALLSLPASLRYHPHHLTYFNEWAGGPDAGSKLLIDSNLDWGQDLHGLAAYLRENEIATIGLAYYGTVHPHSLGIQFSLPPIRHPEPGDYAISANFVAGRPFIFRLPTPDGKPPIPTREQPIPDSKPYQAGLDDFGYFRFFKPRARIGHTISIFHLTPEDVRAFQIAAKRAQGY